MAISSSEKSEKFGPNVLKTNRYLYLIYMLLIIVYTIVYIR